ncbi:MAG: aminopeptidase N [Candidatus Nanopelagicales bacterium]
MGENITRAEARQRSRQISGVAYEVCLDLRGAVTAAETFPSTTVVRFLCQDPADLWVDLIAAEVLEATLNGVALDVSGYDGARLALPARILTAENELRVSAACTYMRTGEGLHRFRDPEDGGTYLYTQFAVADARRVFACFEQPDLKATLRWSVTTPADWLVIANTAAPQPVIAGAEAHWELPTTAILPTYAMALLAGPYARRTDHFTGEYGSYPLALYCRATMLEHLDSEEIFAITKSSLAAFETAFGLGYPFAKYDQIFIPEFNLGAMENAGAVTFREDAFLYRGCATDAQREQRAIVMTHEMAHMWFGNLVTMRWWDDTWLNESFAEWAGHQVTAGATPFTDAWVDFALTRKALAYRADQLPTTHPVAADMADLEAVYLNFDGITYAKGAAIIKALVAWVGEERFLAGLHAYFVKYAWGNTGLNDLLGELATASGRDLRAWASLWLSTCGVNTLALNAQIGADGGYTRVTLHQLASTSDAGDVLRPHRVAITAYRPSAQPVRVEVEIAGGEVEVPALGGLPQSLLVPNSGDLTYAKPRLDDHSLATALAALRGIPDPLDRAQVWGALWDMVRDGELAPAEFVRSVVANLGAESSVASIAAVFRQLPQAVFTYLPDPGDLPAELAAAMGVWLAAAGPGSDAQLVFARGLVRWAQPGAGTDRLHAWLRGRDLPEGLRIDHDLGWEVVVRLAAISGDTALIERAQADDDTMSGRRYAARARAAIPTAATKEAVWGELTGDESPNNAAIEEMLAGWAYPEHAGLLAPFTDRYAAIIRTLWEQRSPAAASQLATGLFPRLQINAYTEAAIDSLLDRDLPTGLRRILREGRDELDRAARVRHRQESHSAGRTAS